MNCSRRAFGRAFQYHAEGLRIDGAKALQEALVVYICGAPGRPREGSVARRRVVAWFGATDPGFVEKQIEVAVAEGRIVRNGSRLMAPGREG